MMNNTSISFNLQLIFSHSFSDFLMSMVNQRRNIFLDKNRIIELCKRVKVEEFKMKKVQLKADEKDTKEEKSEDDDVTIDLLSKELAGLSLTNRERKVNEV